MSIEERLVELCEEVKGVKAEVTDSKRTAPPSNGAGRTIAAVAVALTIAALGTGAGMLIAHDSRLAVVESQTELVTDGRIAIVETKTTALEKDVGEIKIDGKKANSKLDALVGRFRLEDKVKETE